MFDRRLHEVERHRWGLWLRTGGCEFFNAISVGVFLGGMRCEQKNHPWDTARFPAANHHWGSVDPKCCYLDSCLWCTKFRFLCNHLPCTAVFVSDCPIWTPIFLLVVVVVWWTYLKNWLSIALHFFSNFFQLAAQFLSEGTENQDGAPSCGSVLNEFWCESSDRTMVPSGNLT